MKTPLFFLAALFAFFALPLDFNIAASALFGAGLVTILVADYRRDRQLSRSARRMYAGAHLPERFRLAA